MFRMGRPEGIRGVGTEVRSSSNKSKLFVLLRSPSREGEETLLTSEFSRHPYPYSKVFRTILTSQQPRNKSKGKSWSIDVARRRCCLYGLSLSFQTKIWNLKLLYLLSDFRLNFSYKYSMLRSLIFELPRIDLQEIVFLNESRHIMGSWRNAVEVMNLWGSLSSRLCLLIFMFWCILFL